MLSIHIEPGALIGVYSHKPHHKLTGRASQRISKGRTEAQRGKDWFFTYLVKEQNVDLNSQLLGSKACVLYTMLLTHHLEGF